MLESAFGKGVSIVVEESGREDIDAVESADEAGYDDFDELHVRLVRIKFHNDLGN